MSDVTHGTPFSVVPLCSTGLEVTTLLTEGPLQWRALVRWHDGESFIGPHQAHHCPLLAARTTLCWALRHTQRFTQNKVKWKHDKSAIHWCRLGDKLLADQSTSVRLPVLVVPDSRVQWTTRCDFHMGRCCRPENRWAARCHTPPEVGCWCDWSNRGPPSSVHLTHIQQNTETQK